ncbi:hypothetical protein D3C80_938330 [compost metagenome]
MAKLSPEQFLEKERAPLLKMLVPFKRAVSAVLAAGFVLDPNGTDFGYQAPRYDDPNVWRLTDFFGNQSYIKYIGKTGAYVEVKFECPRGNSMKQDDDYLSFDIRVSTVGYHSDAKLTEAQWDVLGEAETDAPFFTTFKKFDKHFTQMMEAVNGLTIPRKYK